MKFLVYHESNGQGTDCGHDSEDEQFSLCCLCGKTFDTKSSLHEHINVVHADVADAFDCPPSTYPVTPPCNTSESTIPVEDTKPDIPEREANCICNTCFRSFPGAASLKVHVDSVHKGFRNPQCQICSKIFSTVSYLRMHIATVHEGVKAYVCSYCSKSYTQKHSLKKHIVTSHPECVVNEENGILRPQSSSNSNESKVVEIETPSSSDSTTQSSIPLADVNSA